MVLDNSSANTSSANTAPQQFDLLIVGGGLAGAALALAMSLNSTSTPLRIALIEGGPLQTWPELEESVYDYDARVSALTDASRQLLDEIGVWPLVAAQRVCGYRDMDVWDAEGTGHIHFSAEEVQRPALGHIVENRLVLAAMHQCLQGCGVSLMFGCKVASFQRSHDGPRLSLADGRVLTAPLVAAADGARSKIREWAGFDTREWDYHHHAIACTVETSLPHQATAWQRFLPEGPLAFLPLADANAEQRYCSIVWSAKPELNQQLMAMNDQDFCHALGRAFEHRLGDVMACGKRVSFPLRQRHAPEYVQDGVVLLGDAAHSIHPLAGQGINLGFADVKVLAEELKRGQARQLTLNDASVLGRYQRRRKGDNLAMMAAMEGFQHLFESNAMPLRLLRNVGMTWLNGRQPIKRELIARAMGLS